MNDAPPPDANSPERLKKLRAQLDHFHNWPSDFTFKFILPACTERETTLRGIFIGAADIKKRASSNGNYWSFTIRENLNGPDEVFDRYNRASEIQDILSL